MSVTPSKISSLWMYQQNDQVYYGSNKNYFDRGAYARPIPNHYVMSGYLKATSGDSLSISAIACGTLASISGGAYSFQSLGSGVFRWTAQVPANYVGAFFIQILTYTNASPDVYHERTIYSSAVTGTGTTAFTGERGLLFKIGENALLSRATIAINITSNANPITVRLYRVDPHDIRSRTLVVTHTVTNLIGTTGAAVINVALDSAIWNPGDVAILTVQSAAPDVMTFAYRDAAGEYNPNGYYFDAGAGGVFSPQTQLPGWTVYSYDSVYSEMVVHSNDPLILVKYRNNKAVDFIPANTEQSTWIRGNFWQPNYPEEFEDIEILPGQFTRLRNEWNRTRKFETDYMPGYSHEHFKHILGCDYVNIDGTEVIQREGYQMDFPNRQYGLVKGQVVLTEKNSIIRNVI